MVHLQPRVGAYVGGGVPATAATTTPTTTTTTATSTYGSGNGRHTSPTYTGMHHVLGYLMCVAWLSGNRV